MSELLKEFKQYLRENEESYKNGARDSIEYPLGYEEVKMLLNEIERLKRNGKRVATDYAIEKSRADKLDNIINELENWLGYEYKHIRNNINFKEALIKLEELKGEDKNENM